MSGKGMEDDYTDTSPLLTIPIIGNSNKLTSGIDQRQDLKRKDNIPSLSLFHCVDPLDIIILMFATLLRVISGFAIPCTLLIMALTFDEFIYYQIAKNEEYLCNQSIKTLEKYITASAPDSVLENEVTHWMYYLFGIATIYMFSLITSYTLWSYSTLKITDRFRVSFLQSILSKDVTWYDLKPLAELPTYLTDNMQIIESGIGRDIAEFMENFSAVILSYILAMIVNWKLSLAMCPIVAMTLLEIAVIVKVASTQGYKRQSALSKAGSIAEEMLSSIRTVVAFGGQTKGIERYQINLTKAKHESYKLHLAVSIASMIGVIFSYSFYAVGLGHGSLLLLNCDTTLGEILTVILLFVHANVVIYIELSSFVGIGGAFGSYKNISTFLHQEPQVDANLSLGTIPNSIEGSIQFSNAVFSYPSRPDIQVLKGLDLSIKPGQTVALVGSSGCGKSTIIKLLMRIYDCNGLISVDGTDVKQLDVHWLRNQIGVVSQEPFLFNVSIAENIRFGKEKATDEELEMASKAANAHDFISELPEGYNTLVGDGGIQLSGGQKQRVAIARALIRNPKILLLDEATSALDTENEKIVQEALDKARVGRTTIIIAHRLSTIKKSDIIMSMDKGHIIEIGSHSELMDNKGLYYQLVMSQTIEDENVKISGANLSEEDVPLITPNIGLNMRENKIKQPYSSSTYINLDEEHAEVNEHNSASITEVFKLNKNNWLLTLTGLICEIIPGILLASSQPILSSAINQLGEADSNDIIQGIIPFVVYFLLLALLLALLYFFGNLALMVSGERFTEVLRLKMFCAMLRQEMAWFDRPENTAGILTTKLAVNPTQVNKVIGYPFALIIQGFVGLLTGTVILFVSSWVLGLMLFPVYIVAVLGQVFQVFVTQKSLVKINALVAKSSKVAVEAIGAIQTVTSLEIKHIIERLYQQKLRKSFKYKFMSRIVHVMIYTVCLSSIMYCGGVAVRVAVILYLSDTSKISAILVAVLLPYIFKSNFLAVRDYQDAVLSIGQINALLQRNPIIDSQSADGQALDECHGELSIKQLHFSYPSRPEVPVLQDMNIHIKPGQTLALVGPSGSGKTTVISLTERFYDPTAGGLLLDGIDLRDFNISWLRHQISLVSQEPALFNTSIADNIRYGVNIREISDKEVVDAAITANIHDFIQSLPQGYKTVVGLKGSQLSGGQKQRVAIARALVQDPKILLLDEATSALDTEIEKIVQDALNKAREGRTTIIVAHRLSTIYNSDKIVVIQKGHVIEEGTHSELMDKQGTYYLMNKIQNL